jgi:hypothetical protein
LPFVRLLTVMGDAVPVLLPGAPPSSDEHETANEVIALPLAEPAVNTIEIDESPPVALVIVGASGAAAGMTADDGADAGLVPLRLVAVTVHV